MLSSLGDLKEHPKAPIEDSLAGSVNGDSLQQKFLPEATTYVERHLCERGLSGSGILKGIKSHNICSGDLLFCRLLLAPRPPASIGDSMSGSIPGFALVQLRKEAEE